MASPLEVLLVTKGHPFERESFFRVFDRLEGIRVTAVEQPAARVFFRPEEAAHWDAFVFYDMPGVEFQPGGGARLPEPPEAMKEDLLALLEHGHAFVFLHHAIASWPAWPEYAEVLGGRFLYEPGELRGRSWPDSGYQLGVRHRVTPTGDHPVTRDLEQGFEIEDELYLCPIFEDEVEPLLRSDARFTDDHFFSAAAAIRGRMFDREGWSHPEGSSLVGWTRRYANSPIVYLALGDGPTAYQNPAFQTLITNAIQWTAEEARAARSR